MADRYSIDVHLRDVTEDDIAAFYEHQRDPAANAMADFPARGWNRHLEHWRRLLTDPAVRKQTIVAGGMVAGNIVSWREGGEREVGYWLDRAVWGQGIATSALTLFLQQETTRPLHAAAVNHNLASLRVLEKCGFRVIEETPWFSGAREDAALVRLRLDERGAAGE